MSSVDDLARRVADLITPRVVAALRPDPPPILDLREDDLRELVGVLYDAMRAPRRAG